MILVSLVRERRASSVSVDSMTGQPYWESAVERQIREAQERGDFDNLPGAGKPLDLSDSGDPDWWVKRFAARENLDLGDALPGPLALRKEAAGYPESLVDVRTEKQVREILEDYNKRVIADRLRPAVGNLPPLIAKTIDIDDMVEQWRPLRAELEDRQRRAPEERAAARAAELATRAPWWRRLFGRGRSYAEVVCPPVGLVSPGGACRRAGVPWAATWARPSPAPAASTTAGRCASVGL